MVIDFVIYWSICHLLMVDYISEDFQESFPVRWDLRMPGKHSSAHLTYAFHHWIKSQNKKQLRKYVDGELRLNQLLIGLQWMIKNYERKSFKVLWLTMSYHEVLCLLFKMLAMHEQNPGKVRGKVYGKSPEKDFRIDSQLENHRKIIRKLPK